MSLRIFLPETGRPNCGKKSIVQRTKRPFVKRNARRRGEDRSRGRLRLFPGLYQFGDEVERIGWSRGAGLSRAKSTRGAYTEKSEKNQHDVDGRSRRSVSPITAMHSRRFFLFYKQKRGNEKNNVLE